jgi:cysteine desulfurase
MGKAITDLKPKIYNLKPAFHVDAVQAIKFLNCNVEKLGCDLLTLSGHKIYGPKGIAALYVKQGLKTANLTFGGSQEYGRRPGTQNTVGIIGLAAAIELLGSLEERQKMGEEISVLRDRLIKGIPDGELNGPTEEDRSPDNVSFTFYDTDQDELMTALDLEGIAASTGSACVSGSSKPSHVIEALGKSSDRKAATVRFSLGKDTSEAEIDKTIAITKKIIQRLKHG